MKLRGLVAALVLALGVAAPALAQRGGGGNWELLGETRVGFGNDRDTVEINHSEDHYRSRAYRRIRLIADGGEVRMKDIRLIYQNGHTENVDVSRTLRSGEEVNLDLRGERTHLRQIIMNYQSKFGFSLGGGGLRVNTPTVKIFGENARGGPAYVPPPPPPPTVRAPSGWNEIAREGFSRSDDSVQIRVGRREGRIGQIRFQNERDRVEIRDVTIRFGNGETQRVAVDQPLDTGEITRSIDVEGEQRFIEQITLRMRPQRRGGQAEIAVLATERVGREGSGREGGGGTSGGGDRRANWQLLGEQAVGFRSDRDVIRVNQNEAWHRERGFDKLHFIAERNDVHMMAIRVRYINGQIEEIPVDRLIRSGQDLAVDLPGRRSYIREIEMNYRSRPGGGGGQATVKVYGESGGGGRR